MKRRTIVLAIGAASAGSAFAQLPNLGDVIKGIERLPRAPATTGTAGAADDRTNVAGIKEALAVGTERAVKNLARRDGYFGNEAVKTLMPGNLQKVADVARMAGYQQQVDDFILSMNRAAEAAVPLATKHFGDAIRSMTLDDVRGILMGADTAATDFFRRKTQDGLYTAFRPIVSKKVDEVGATRAYKTLMSRYENVPFVSKQSLDLDDYVTRKSLDGLFHMVGEEEKRIRTDPVARSTELLRTVFGR